MANHLYSIHDWSSEWGRLIRDAGVSGWAVISEGIGDDPNDLSGQDYASLGAYNVTPLVRLNYSHHGQGTIPLPHRYENFAQRCANFVSSSQGCKHWIIGNEPNWSIERPSGSYISPQMYATAFNRCRAAIKRISPHHQVITGAVAPYNAESGSWIDYYTSMLSAIIEADGIALHFYSRGTDPSAISSEARMEPPFHHYRNGFRAYRDFLEATPAKFKNLPVYATEANQMVPWENANSGWVRAAYDEIKTWNASGGQKIHCLTLYRWENYDQFGIKGKQGVVDDFKDALRQGEPVQPPPVQPPQPKPTVTEWDPRLSNRGVHLLPAHVPPGQTYWRLVKAQWLDTPEARKFGPDHHILVDALDERGIRQTGVSFIITWPSGSDRITTKGNNGYRWAADYPMSKSLNEFSIVAVDGLPSDEVIGIGMGKDGNPAEHTSTYLVFQKAVAEAQPVPPQPNPDKISLHHPVVDPQYRRVTQPFGARPEYYSQFKIDGVPLKGHEGIDFGTPVGSLIQAVYDGTVVESADQGGVGYGRYIKLSHSWGESVYAHLEYQMVRVGETVSGGEIIARSGATGNVTGAHLHFGLRISPFNRKDGWGGYTDPAPFLSDSPKEALVKIVLDAAKEFGVEWGLMVSLVHAESSFNPRSVNTRTGASGLGNIMPATWQEWSVKLGAKDIFNPRDNARVTAAYLAWCIKTAGSVRKGLWAYQWGIGNVQRNPELVPQEVIEYATKVIHGSEVYKLMEGV